MLESLLTSEAMLWIQHEKFLYQIDTLGGDLAELSMVKVIIQINDLLKHDSLIVSLER